MAISLTSARLFRFHFVSRVLYGWAGFQSVLLLAFSKYFVFMKESLVKERTIFNSLSGVTYGHTQRKSANNLWGVRCYYYIFFLFWSYCNASCYCDRPVWTLCIVFLSFFPKGKRFSRAAKSWEPPMSRMEHSTSPIWKHSPQRILLTSQKFATTPNIPTRSH